MRSRRPALRVLVITAFLAGCASAATTPGGDPSSDASVPPSAIATERPPLPTQTSSPTAPPPPSFPPATTPLPPPPPATGWTAPEVISAGECSGVSAAVDAAGGRHVAAVCEAGIRYLTSATGATWSHGKVSVPFAASDVGPILAIDDRTIYLAFTRIATEDGGCGNDGLRDEGTYVQSRELPDGTWTRPWQIGEPGDSVQALRAVGGTLHVIVTAAEGTELYYVSVSSSSETRLPLPGAIGASLRVGDDGRPRIAFSTGRAIRYATVSGGRMTIETLAESEETYLKAPALVLAPGDHAYLTWTQHQDPGGGCVELEAGPLDGTYFGTNAGGTWSSARVTTLIAPASLTLDPSTLRVHVLVDWSLDSRDLTHFTKPKGGAWTSTTLPGTGATSSAIRLDPTTGRAVVFATLWGQWIDGIAVFEGPTVDRR